MTTSAASPMATPAPKGLPPQMAQNALAYLRRAIEKMKVLQAVERVMTGVERVMLNRVSDKLDLYLLVTAINALNLALREGDQEKVREAVFTVSQELDAVLQLLIARDAEIVPYHLRRFYEEETSSLDLSTLAALTSFYRALPHSETNQGKYDFVVTRLFSHTEPDPSSRVCSVRHRHLRISREQLTKRLTEMCLAWGEVIARDPADAVKISQSIELFDHFMAEVKEINKFEELVSRAFFQRIRDSKAKIGALLYLPEVTAASIESNVVITNCFLTLLETESEAIQAAPQVMQSFAGAFSDTYSTKPDEVAAILRELKASVQQDEVAQERVARLSHLLQLSTATKDAPILSFPSMPENFAVEFDHATDSPSEPVFVAEPVVTAEPVEELQSFTTAPENQPLLTAYANASTEARRLDLYSFLAPLPNDDQGELQGESTSRRAALKLIFQADNLVQTELGKECDPGADIEARVEKLFDQLEQVSDEVRDYIKAVQKHEQNANYEVLLHVYNQLMTTRLRLQSALLRRSSDNTAANAPVPPVAEARQNIAPASINSESKPWSWHTPVLLRGASISANSESKTPGARISLRQWLVITTVVLLIAAVSFNFTLAKKPVATDDAAVKQMDRSQMPHGAFLTEAKLHQELMLCFVTQKWLELSAQDQKAKLQELLSFGQERGVQRVLLIDPKGTTVGFMTKEEVFVN